MGVRTPPPAGGGTETVPLPERQNGTGTNQLTEGGGGPPQPANGVGGGTGPLLSERDRRIKIKEIDGFTLFKDHPDPQVNLDKMVEMVMMDKHHSCPEG